MVCQAEDPQVERKVACQVERKVVCQVEVRPAEDPTHQEEHQVEHRVEARQVEGPNRQEASRAAAHREEDHSHRREVSQAAGPNHREDHHQVDNHHRPIRAPSRSASARSPLSNLER
jgi:hypothetical protein